MSDKEYIEQIFPIKCRGRDNLKKQVLNKPVAVSLRASQVAGYEEGISLSVKCEHNTGSHGQRCKASHPDADKNDIDVYCPYSSDIPYVFDL
jgi:hypothetical protein